MPSPLAVAGREDYARVLDTVTIARAMTRQLATAVPAEPPSTAAERMLDLGVHCLPVVENGRLLRLLTDRGCMRAFVEQMRVGSLPPPPTMRALDGREAPR